MPVIGGLVVGLFARYGSDRIRGHGMPEAIEAVLMRGAKISPRITVIKPVATAIAIGSGGPFGAEGPIIMTGGAAGSLLAQLFRMSDAERSTLLVAGAAAGMSATFLAPLAAILLAVELLLFELRPRSLMGMNHDGRALFTRSAPHRARAPGLLSRNRCHFAPWAPRSARSLRRLLRSP